jgi:hypothetical protein
MMIATTITYLKQKQPSFITIEIRARNSMMIIINANRISKANEILNTTVIPIQPSLNYEKVTDPTLSNLPNLGRLSRSYRNNL